MIMKIAILEDQEHDSNRLIKKIQEWSSLRQFEIETHLYRSGEEFFSKNTDNFSDFCIYFLDIQMGEMGGVEVAKRLRMNGYTDTIIFLTAFREYVFAGYEVHALNYLLKPVQDDPLFLCLDEIANNMTGNSYLFRNKQDIIRIPYKDILSFSSCLHYVDILTVDETYQQYSTLNSIIEHLPKEFIRIHKSCIVNISHIRMIKKNVIVLSNRMTATIGRSYIKSVIESFTEYSTRFDKKGDFTC